MLTLQKRQTPPQKNWLVNSLLICSGIRSDARWGCLWPSRRRSEANRDWQHLCPHIPAASAVLRGPRSGTLAGVCAWSSARTMLMLGKCQARKRPGPASPEPGSGAQRGSDMIVDGGYDTCEQRLHTAIWSALRCCQKALTTGAWWERR